MALVYWLLLSLELNTSTLNGQKNIMVARNWQKLYLLGKQYRPGGWFITLALVVCRLIVESCSGSRTNQPETIWLDYTYYNPVALAKA